MTWVLILLLSALAAWAVVKTVQKARKGGGCCGEHEAAPARAPAQDRDKRHYHYEASLKIGGMTCDNCARRVENALNGLDGVLAHVSIDTASAQVKTKKPPDEQTLRQAVRQAGYVVTEYRTKS